jgi:hypothetical protein
MASRETTIITRETVIIETTIIERVVYRGRGRGPGAGPPVLLMVFFALVFVFFAVYLLMFCGPAFTLLGIILLLMSFTLMAGTYLSLA